MDWIETRFAFAPADVSAADVDDDDDGDDDDADDDDDDDDDDDAEAAPCCWPFFSLASCCAFFERFHFIRRFWNQILTCSWKKNKNEKKKKKW